MVKYFLDKKGVMTRRLAGRPGAGHYDLASEVLQDLGHRLAPDHDLYQQMFTYGFVRVVETEKEIFAEAPKPLTKAQKDFFLDKQADGYAVMVNNHQFVESKDSRNGTKPIHA